MKKIIISLIALAMCGTECAAQSVSGQKNGHDYVDLGLPSGKLWATCNVGATQPTEPGNLYAFGETQPKSDYTFENYKWDKRTIFGKRKRTKYKAECSMDDTEKVKLKLLHSKDDAATVNWGKMWCTPVGEEFDELEQGCEWTMTENFEGSGRRGVIGTSKKNGNTIFFTIEDGYWDAMYCTTGEFTGIYLHPEYWGSEESIFGGCKTIQEAGLSVRAIIRRPSDK